jgi:hypothetical protein
MTEWWVERWFRRFDERGSVVEFVADGRAIAGSWCPLCGQVVVITWTNDTITFTCEASCDEEFIAQELGAL